MLVTDFKRSFITWKVHNNLSGRFGVEASLNYENTTSYLLHGVLACKVLESDEMIHTPSYLFQAAFSENRFHIYRINNIWGNSKDTNGANDSGFEDIQFYCPMVEEPILTTASDVCEAVLNNQQISATVVYSTAGKQTQISFPVKHINVEHETNRWQIETGPVLVPYLNSEPSILPAYLAINSNGNMDIAPLLTEPGNHARFYQKKITLSAQVTLSKAS